MSATGKTLFRSLVSAAALSACPIAAQAGNGFYLGLEGGANFLQHQQFQLYNFNTPLGATVADGTQVSDVGFSAGYLGGLNLGYAFSSGPRLELELAHRGNGFDSIRLSNDRDSTVVGGKENTDTALANLWFDLFKSGWLHPYVGGGFGVARVDVRNPRTDSAPLLFDGSALNSAFDVVRAYQLGAGFIFDFGAHWSASLDYRYLNTAKGKFNLLENNPNSHIETDYESHSALLSIRYYFSGPPPAAAPEPPPEPTQIVPVVEAPPAEEPPPLPSPPAPPCQPPLPGQPISLDGCKTGDVIVLRGVNFEFNKSSLTVNAKTLLDQVVTALTLHGDIKIAIQGHTDSKGSDSYNQKLSEQRAKSVGQYLANHGIAAGRVGTAGFGETMPIASNVTDEGRELNRRVELKITEVGDSVVAVPAQASETAPAEAAPLP